MSVTIIVSEARRKALEEAGQPVPSPQPIRALVDTGASCTCVDPSILQALSLSPTAEVPAHVASDRDEPEFLEQYDVGIAIPGARSHHHPLVHPTVPVLSSKLSIQGIQALIGRDILANCVLIYNGTTNFFTLAF